MDPTRVLVRKLGGREAILEAKRLFTQIHWNWTIPDARFGEADVQSHLYNYVSLRGQHAKCYKRRSQQPF